MGEIISGLVGLIVVAGIGLLAFLFFTSQAVLYSEKESQLLGIGYVCYYFTGLRSVEQYTPNPVGCPRFIKVGE